MSKHTPGPWEANGNIVTHTLPNAFTYSTLIATASMAPHWEQACSNARLIAAAPEMLTLLRATFDALYADPTSVSVGKLIHDIEDLLHRVDGNE